MQVPSRRSARFSQSGSSVLVRVLCVGTVFLAACGAPDSAGRRPLTDAPGSGAPGGPMGGSAELPPGMTAIAAAHLDSGNVAFRARNYEQALRYYRTAALDVPQHPAPWYGVLMVGQATGNRALADSATAAVATRSGGGDLLQTDAAKAHQAPTASMPPAGQQSPPPTR